MFRKIIGGLSTLKDWWEEGGKPVSKTLSQNRSDICTGKANGNPCPFNKPGFVPIEAAAGFLKYQIEKKNQLKLAVDGEEKLHTCTICWCKLSLKVHTPLEIILANADVETLNEFKTKKPDCWINTELNEPD